MVSHDFNRKRYEELRQLLDEYYAQLVDFQLELARAEGGGQRVKLRRQIAVDILPKLGSYEDEFAAQLAAGASESSIPTDEAEVIVAELVKVTSTLQEGEGVRDQIRSLAKQLKEQLDEPGRSAAAKLKVALPIIPGIARYELELDTENLVNQVWRKARDLFQRAVLQNPQ